jgi:hypothetical protein
MTTQEVADRYIALDKEGKWMDIQSELYSQDIICIEPEHVATSMGMPVITKGLAAVQAKAVAFNEMIEEVHGAYCSEPVIGGTYFSVSMGMDCTMKAGNRMKMDEIAVFQVKDGKIVIEQFFY